jgi:hypothetical protein
MEYAAIAAAAVQAAGSIMQGNAQSAQYKAQAQANDYNATVARQNADVALQQANAREEIQRRKFGDLQGTAIAAAAQSGAGMDGSNADVLKQNAIAAELDALTIRYEGQMQARGLMAQSEMEQFQGRMNRTNSRTAQTAGYINAGANLLGGASKAYTMQQKPAFNGVP